MKQALVFLTILLLTLFLLIFFLPREAKEARVIEPTDQEYLLLKASLPDADQLTKRTEFYNSDAPEDENLEDVQCPIPKSDRVPNYTGIQCVWSSIEMLGRFAEEPKLTNPPITSRANCKSYASPSSAAERLTELKVKFEQTNRDRVAGVALIKKAMAEGRGCLFDVPGHAMTLIHYDEQKDVVKWVDNSDRRLAVQTMNIAKFNQRWGSWVLVIYADQDIIPLKTGRAARSIPILENGVPLNLPKDFIPIPNRENLIEIPR